MVMAQCLFAALLRADGSAPIDVLAPDWVRPLAARMPQIRTAIAMPMGHGEFAFLARRRLGRALRGRYSHAFVLPGSWKSALVPYFAGIEHRVGYLREWRWGLLNDIRELPAEMTAKTARAFQALAEPAVIEDAARLIEPKLDVDPQNQGRLLAAHGLAAGRFAVLAPGAEYGPAKRWPAQHWAALATALSARGLTSVLLGSVKDRQPLGAELLLHPAMRDLMGATSLGDAIDLIAASRFAVTNDSGLMHIAAAAGAPLIALYGSTSPEHTPPLSSRARVISLGLACSPCRARDCPLGHLDCLVQLAPAGVLAEAEAMGLLPPDQGKARP